MYLSKLEIKNLWGLDIKWNLNNDVNILVGNNGAGKSNILRMLNQAVSAKNDLEVNYRVFDAIDEMIIELENENIIQINSEERKILGINEFSNINVSYIDTFDTPLNNSNVSETLLDTLLIGKNGLKEKFILYQRNLSKSVEEIFTKTDTSSEIDKFKEIEKLYTAKKIFNRQINSLFKETGKTFDDENFNFKKNGITNPIEIEKLSSGEKQILIILLTVLLQNQKKYVLILDEPEISMHIDWQRVLIDYIVELNPNCQVIIATHSPTIFYKGRDHKMQRFENIATPTDLTQQSSIILEQLNKIPNRFEVVRTKFNNIKEKNIQSKIYLFNNILNSITTFTFEETKQILTNLVQRKVKPDVITFTTLISKLNTFEEAEQLFDLMQNYDITPNEYSLNNILKKIPDIETGINFIGKMKMYNIYPDIITFSTLLSKAKNAKEVENVEKARKYYGVQPGKIYLNKLKIKQ